MVIDAAKGIEARTRKLFEVCRLRDIPIVTFINKMDRETRDPFDLLDEIEKTLALETAPLTWTIGRGRSLAGAYDIRRKTLTPLGKEAEAIQVTGPDDPRVAALLPEHERAEAIDELHLAVEGLKPFDKQAYLEGHLTPVLWGSALKDFGVKDLIDAMAEFAPSPRAQEAASRTVKADEAKMTGFVFKIQANMDPNHRDRIAFMRVCSGKLQRGMRAKLVRTGKPVTLSAPQFFFAQDRSLADEAFAGDVVGIPNHGLLRIGDTLSEGEEIVFRGVPSFAPEILRRVKLSDAMKAKKLKEALQQMAEEGVVQVFLPHDGAAAIVGVVGALQLDVLVERLNAEYGLPVTFEQSRFEVCRWVSLGGQGGDWRNSSTPIPRRSPRISTARPSSWRPVAFNLRYEQERWPKIAFTDVKDYQKAAALRGGLSRGFSIRQAAEPAKPGRPDGGPPVTFCRTRVLGPRN